MHDEASRDITAESLTEALAAISFGKTHTSTDNSEVNLDIMTEEEQIAYATKISIQPESDWNCLFFISWNMFQYDIEKHYQKSFPLTSLYMLEFFNELWIEIEKDRKMN